MAASTTSKTPKEPSFEINNFNLPDERDNVDEWIELIRSLIFMEKGTYSDDPDCGVHIATYEFGDLVRDSGALQSEIERQCKAYLSDVPIGTLVVQSFYNEDRNIYVVKILVGFVEGSVKTQREIQISDEDGVLSSIIAKFDEK